MVAGAARLPGPADRRARLGRAGVFDLPALKARTLGHASLALYREGEAPLLVTDPWLVGSAYWRSWWLQHYPDAEELDWLARSAHVYVTHEHPDHFHMPSIRRLGRGPTYLFPDLAERRYLDYMAGRGYRAEVVAPRRWRAIGGGVSILSIPVWSDDSLLLADTPAALILNLNDAKPLPPVLRAIRRAADRIDKPRVLLCSYSPASLVNSFLDDAGVVSLKPARHYVDYVCRLCDRLAADFYMPFASQAVFERADSRWANDYRTTHQDLERHWRSRATLLPPYSTLDLAGLTHCSTPPAQYRGPAPAALARLTQERGEAEEAAEITAEDIAALERKLRRFRRLLRLFFPPGFAVRLGERSLRYDPRSGRLRDGGAAAGQGDFAIEVPKLTMKEALANNHVSDLGITMFVRIRLLRRLDPRKIYALFVLFQLDDYGHLASAGSLLRWLWRGIRCTLIPRLPAPAPRLSRDAGRRPGAPLSADN